MSTRSMRGHVGPGPHRLIVGVFTLLAVLLCGPPGHTAAEAHPDGHHDVTTATTAAPPHGHPAVYAGGPATRAPDHPESHAHELAAADGYAAGHTCGRPTTVSDQFVPGGARAVAVPALPAAAHRPGLPAARGDQRQLSGRSLLTGQCVSRT